MGQLQTMLGKETGAFLRGGGCSRGVSLHHRSWLPTIDASLGTQIAEWAGVLEIRRFKELLCAFKSLRIDTCF